MGGRYLSASKSSIETQDVANLKKWAMASTFVSASGLVHNAEPLKDFDRERYGFGVFGILVLKKFAVAEPDAVVESVEVSADLDRATVLAETSEPDAGKKSTEMEASPIVEGNPETASTSNEITQLGDVVTLEPCAAGADQRIAVAKIVTAEESTSDMPAINENNACPNNIAAAIEPTVETTLEAAPSIGDSTGSTDFATADESVSDAGASNGNSIHPDEAST